MSSFNSFLNQCVQLDRLYKMVIKLGAHHGHDGQNSGTKVTLSDWFYENFRIMNRLFRHILVFKRWSWSRFNFITSDCSTDGVWEQSWFIKLNVSMSILVHLWDLDRIWPKGSLLCPHSDFHRHDVPQTLLPTCRDEQAEHIGWEKNLSMSEEKVSLKSP